MRTARPARRIVRGTIHTPMAMAMIGSTHCQSVTEMTTAATMTPTEPTVSASTSRYAPSTLSDSAAPSRSRAKATRLAARPATAMASIHPLSTSVGSANRRSASTST